MRARALVIKLKPIVRISMLTNVCTVWSELPAATSAYANVHCTLCRVRVCVCVPARLQLRSWK